MYLIRGKRQEIGFKCQKSSKKAWRNNKKVDLTDIKYIICSVRRTIPLKLQRRYFSPAWREFFVSWIREQETPKKDLNITR